MLAELCAYEDFQELKGNALKYEGMDRYKFRFQKISN